jgi:hypothetical protein
MPVQAAQVTWPAPKCALQADRHGRVKKTPHSGDADEPPATQLGIGLVPNEAESEVSMGDAILTAQSSHLAAFHPATTERFDSPRSRGVASVHRPSLPSPLPANTRPRRSPRHRPCPCHPCLGPHRTCRRRRRNRLCPQAHRLLDLRKGWWHWKQNESEKVGRNPGAPPSYRGRHTDRSHSVDR